MYSLLRNTIVGAIFASTGLAQGTVRVINACSFDIYYTLADSTGSNNAVNTLVYGGIYSETQDPNPGRVIKIATSQGALPDGSPIIQFEYSVSGGTIYYDLSTLNGNPFGNNADITPSDSSCQTVGVGAAYQDPAGVVFSCPATTDLDLYTCAST